MAVVSVAFLMINSDRTLGNRTAKWAISSMKWGLEITADLARLRQGCGSWQHRAAAG